MNLADIGTGGMTISGLMESEWFVGPAWLKEDGTEWPLLQNPWQKKVDALMDTTEKSLLERNVYSSWSKLWKIIAYCLRWKFCPDKARNEFFGIEGRQRAGIALLQWCQRKSSRRFWERSKRNQWSPRVKYKAKFGPFLDKDGLIHCVSVSKHRNGILWALRSQSHTTKPQEIVLFVHMSQY